MKIHTWLGCTRPNGLLLGYLAEKQKALLINQHRPLSQTPISEELQSQTKSFGNIQAQVISFRRFIPLHAGFMNKPTKPKYLEKAVTDANFKGEHDSDLGNVLKNILETHIKAGRDELAANVLRNAIYSGFLISPSTVNEMRDIFINFLDTEFQNNTLNYLDILVYFIKNEEDFDNEIRDKSTLCFQLFKDSLNRGLSRSSYLIHRDRVEKKILQASEYLSKYDESSKLLNLFHYEVSKTLIKRRHFEFLQYVDFACLSNENAAKLVTKLKISQCYLEAIDLIIVNGVQVEEHVIFGLYKRVTNLKNEGSFKITDDKLTTFEEWMCKNGFDNLVDETKTSKKKMEHDMYDWNELDHTK